MCKAIVQGLRAVPDLPACSAVPLSFAQVGDRFTSRGAWNKRLPQLLDMLVDLGRAGVLGNRYAGGL